MEAMDARRVPREPLEGRTGAWCATRGWRARIGGEAGYALIAVLFITTILLAAGTIGVRVSRLEVKIASNELMAQKALHVADAGLDHAFSLMQLDGDGFDDELAAVGTAGALSSVGGVATVAGVDYRFRQFGGKWATDGYYVRIVDNFDEIAGGNDPAADADDRVTLVALGKVARAERLVETIVERVPLFPGAGIIGREYVTVAGGTVVDSYSSADGPYPNEPSDQGNVMTNGDVALKGSGTTVNGSATAGGNVVAGSGSVTGDIVEEADPFELEPVLPCGPPYSDGAGISGGDYDPTTGELKARGRGNNITLAAGVYCISSVTIGSGNTITIKDAVQLVLTGTGSFAGNSIVNTTGLAANFQIYSSYSGTATGVTLAGGSGAAAAVYAPESAIKVTGDGEFLGGVVGKSVDIPGGAQFHYDVSLDDLRGRILARQGWREVRNL